MWHGLINLNIYSVLKARPLGDFSSDPWREGLTDSQGGGQYNREGCQFSVGLKSAGMKYRLFAWMHHCSHSAEAACSTSLSLAMGTICLNHLPSPFHFFFFLARESSLTVDMPTTQTVLSWPQRCHTLPLYVRRETRRVIVLRNFCLAELSHPNRKYGKKAI